MKNKVITSNKDCSLVVELSQDTDRLFINYNFKNESSQKIYLLNKLARIGGESIFDIDINATNIEIDSESVIVSKALLPVPEDREIEKPYIPCLTAVSIGMTFKESVVLPYPLEPFTWYSGRPLTKNPISKKLFFEIGYVLVNFNTEKFIEKVNTDYNTEYISNYLPFYLQSKIKSPLLLPTTSVYSTK